MWDNFVIIALLYTYLDIVKIINCITGILDAVQLPESTNIILKKGIVFPDISQTLAQSILKLFF